MRNRVLKAWLRFPVRLAIGSLALLTGVSTTSHFAAPPGGRDSMPTATRTAAFLPQDPCGGGPGDGTPHPCSEISCGDYMCPCDPGPSDCYYAWASGCYNF